MRATAPGAASGHIAASTNEPFTTPSRLTTRLEHTPMPPPVLVACGSAASLVWGTFETDWCSTDRWVTVPDSEFRIVTPPDVAGGPLRIACEDAAVHVDLVVHGPDGEHVTPIAAGTRGEAVAPAGATHVAVRQPARAGPLPHLQVRCELVDPSTGVADRPGGAATRVIDTIVEAIDRLDDALHGWRTAGPGRGPRPIEIVAARRAHATTPGLPAGGVELVGFVSEFWDRRLASGAWEARWRNGADVGLDDLDRYGRSGGLVACVYAREWSLPPTDEAERATEPDLLALPAELFGGDRAGWVRARRDAENVIEQLASMAYATHQRDAEATAPTTLAWHDDAVAEIEAALRHCWHPAFSQDIDVAHRAAAGLNRHRFSDPFYERRAPAIFASTLATLASIGVRSGPVIFS